MFPFMHDVHQMLRPGRFSMSYICNSVSMLQGPERQDVDRGGKIILPPSALENLTNLNVQYPMLFKLSNPRAARESHCGVLEFVADEGHAYLPYWMMSNLCLEEGSTIHLESVSLPVAKFAKFQPQSIEFLDITNPKAVLENALRNFACLTTGDMIAITYNEKVYELKVLETQPQKAVTIIECDMNVDFAAPVGYQEPAKPQKRRPDESEETPMSVDVTESSSFQAFKCPGNRLDGKVKSPEKSADTSAKPRDVKRGIPNYNHKKGTINLKWEPRKSDATANGNSAGESFTPFSGEGHSLHKR